MVHENPFLRLLDSSLSPFLPCEPVEIVGQWSTTKRRTYQSERQLGGGVGPFVEVEDRFPFVRPVWLRLPRRKMLPALSSSFLAAF